MSHEEEQYDMYEEDTQRGKYLTFKLVNESYGIEIKYVIEIIGLQPVTIVPELPDYMQGIINLRGKIIPVMDVRLRFKKPFREYNDRTCVIVIEIEDITIGLIVDSVSEVLAIPESEIVSPTELGQSHRNKYIKGIGKSGDEVKLILDCAKLLQEQDVTNLTALT
ncbi:purine-binding chemotaxis protein CheW [Paenibacillus phyllosphaerae]|uniref:Purine-binding chemotaxis protein CheW n=1 Tax=Paenibacillus phyllosphaerae TaxID=274593 RepID=A0A7W5FMA8_9BACL|nr:chemotaxis protein CheW [Paenibacillus phyllosphaerae]MBB3109814.1 purine-binding chemotaxis protein CheW [Paenibacillus phyllosphaerae]